MPANHILAGIMCPLPNPSLAVKLMLKVSQNVGVEEKLKIQMKILQKEPPTKDYG